MTTGHLSPYKQNFALRFSIFCIFIQSNDIGIKCNKKLLLKHTLKHDLGWKNNCRILHTMQKGIWVPAVIRSCILITTTHNMPKISMQELQNSQYFSLGHVRQKVPWFLFFPSDFMPTYTQKAVVWSFCPCDILHQSHSSHKFIFKELLFIYVCLIKNFLCCFSPHPLQD